MLIKQSKSVTQLFIYRANDMKTVLKIVALSVMLISCGMNAAGQKKVVEYKSNKTANANTIYSVQSLLTKSEQELQIVVIQASKLQLLLKQASLQNLACLECNLTGEQGDLRLIHANITAAKSQFEQAITLLKSLIRLTTK